MSTRIKFLYYIVCIIVFLAFIFISLKFHNFITPFPTTKINHALNEFSEPAMIGIQIQSMSSHQIVYQKNVQQAFIPASTLKLFTATAALLYLGKDYKYQTVLMRDRQNNYYLKFSGDPDLTTTDIDHLFQQLSDKNIDTIRNLYLDNDQFDHQYALQNYGPGWMVDDLIFCYAAPITSIIINKNCAIHTLTSSGLIVAPENKFLILAGGIFYNSISSDHKNACEFHIEEDRINNSLMLMGCLPNDLKPTPEPLSIQNPELYAKTLSAILLEKYKIKSLGHIDIKKLPDINTEIIAQHESPPVRILVNEMLKNSDNIIADSLLKTMGGMYFKQPGNFENGVNAVQQILTKNTNIDLMHFVMVDGSGQSRYNLVTPSQISYLLNYIYQNFSIRSEMISGLPIMGIDGTLSKRMVNMPILIRAKTGSMTGVNGLAGYIKAQNGEIYSIVILLNNHIGTDESANNLEDEISKIIADVG